MEIKEKELEIKIRNIMYQIPNIIDESVERRNQMAKMKAQKAKQDRRSDATELYGLSHLPDDVLSDLIKKRRPVVRNWIDRTDNKAPSIVRLGHPLANALSNMIDIYESYGCSDEETLLAEAAILSAVFVILWKKKR